MKKPKTARERLADAIALVEKLRPLAAAEEALENVQEGDDIDFTYGRGTRKRTLTGVVTAIGQDDQMGKLLAVRTGEGLDAQIVKVQAIAVVENRSAAKRAAEAIASEDPLKNA